MNPPKIVPRVMVIPQRVPVVSRVARDQSTRVLDNTPREPQQLSLFGRPAGAYTGPSRTD